MMFRKLAYLGFMLVLGLTVSASAFAQDAPPRKDVMQNVGSYVQWNSPVQISLDGKVLPVRGEMINARILIPVRAVFESAGADVVWDGQTYAAHVVGSGYSFTLRPGSASFVIRDQTIELDHPVAVLDGKLFVSARLASHIFDTSLQWDSANRTLSLRTAKPADGLRVTSDAFGPNGNIPAVHASPDVGGENISIPVRWSGAPANTKSYAVIIFDAHPIADQFVHAAVFNLPASKLELESGEIDRLDAGTRAAGYYGMQPPRHSGDHPYRIKVFALNRETIELPELSPYLFYEELEPCLQDYVVASGELQGFFRG